ncbi:M24 family metallopeptidase [Carnimonas bestiolae]|uniref:M24 family metallopeptidase n=1 Tax=Carnimonas bestiolae TaxID=3402172 RepID=UPI003EDCB09D
MEITPTFKNPDTHEINARIDKIRGQMSRLGLDYYVSFSPDNIFYLTNFKNMVHERPFILVVTPKGPLQFISPLLEAKHVHARSVGDIEILPYFEFPAPKGKEWSDVFKQAVPAGSKVGIESVCPHQIYAAIEGEAVEVNLIDDARAIKSPFEINRIAYSCELITKAHDEFMAAAAPGRTVIETASAAQQSIIGQLLQDDPSYNPFCTRVGAVFQNGRTTFDPHNFSTINIAMEANGGPHLTIINSELSGYGAEVERTFFLGSATDEEKKYFDIMMEGRNLAYELAKPGTLMSDVDRAVNDLFKSKGVGDLLLHRTGHGMGITAHESPFLAEGCEQELQENMTFTIEPGIYSEKFGGFRHSDTIVVGKDGPINLTETPDDLDSLILPIK